MRRLYACTIFCSSSLVFLVQPVIAKAMLPWFGGSAGVWTSAMLFFQVTLLLGYAYAHAATRFIPRNLRVPLHVALLAASCLAIPIASPDSWTSRASDPAARILAMLAVSLGLPYLLLTSTGPLVQSWFSRLSKPQSAYRLFAISNIASLAALLAY